MSTNNTSLTGVENTVQAPQTTKTPAEIISNLMNVWEEYEFYDTDLWDSFREDRFENYTENDFKLVSNQQIRKLRDFLRQRGVWVEKSTRTPIATALYNVLQEGERTAWSRKEILKCDGEEHFTSPKIRNFLARERREKIEAEAVKAASSAFLSRSPSRPISPTAAYRKTPLVAPAPAPASAPTPASTPLAAPPQQTPRPVLSFSVIAEISIPPVQPQQSEQSTSPPPEKFNQNQPAPQQQSPVQQTPSQPTPSNPPQSPQPSIPPTYVATRGIAAPILNSKTPQSAASLTTPKIPQAATLLISPKTPQAAVLGCTFYKKGMG